MLAERAADSLESGWADEEARDMRRRQRRRLAHGVVTAVASVAAVALLRWLLHPVLQVGVPYTMFLASVAVSTHLQGWRCGVMVMLLSTLVGTHLFVLPSSHLETAPDIVTTVAVFIFSSCLVILPIERDRTTRRHLQERERLLRNSYAERSALERQLEEARRLESLGRLAGGIAHDFNNLTTVILGSAELLQREVPNNRLLDAIIVAAMRSSEITKQLLGLGRRQRMELRAMSINQVAEEALQLCERLLPENITIQLQLESAPWLFKGDGALLQQVLLNLLTNARDAMPQGGVVRLESENVGVDAQFSREHPEVQPGEYVRIGVSDAGVGIDEQTRRHIFEPFFSAKPKGTGLGLAVVYGLVKQLEGTIIVESQPGSGSRFDVYLPRVVASDAGAERAAPPVDETRPRLRTMLVEDHPLVRAVLTRMLDQLGHQTVVAEDGKIALRLAAQQSEPLDALITDIGMPNMDGYELAEHMRARYPGLGIVLVSGYDQYDQLHRAGSRTGLVFLGKPFTAPQLDQALAEARAKAHADSTRRRSWLSRPAAG